MDEKSADIDEDVPPLEDMSEELEKIKALRTESKKLSHGLSLKQEAALKPAISMNDSKNKQHIKESSKIVRTKEKTASNSKSSFGGFKKGFLVSSSDSKPKVKRTPPKKAQAAPTLTAGASSKDTDIPFIQPKNKGKSSLEFPEVQQAMKEAFPLLQSKDWVTDDFLSKIHNNPVLSEAFTDPALGQVLAQLQSNPQAVAAKAKDNPKIQKFIQEFCALMGDHFTMLADKEEENQAAAATKSPHVSEAMSSEEEAQMREIMSRPQVKEALSDPRIEELIINLKDDPPAAQKLLQSGDEDFRRKVKVLIDNELVSFQF